MHHSESYSAWLVIAGLSIVIGYAIPFVCVLAVPFGLLILLWLLFSSRRLKLGAHIGVIVLLCLVVLRIIGFATGLIMVKSIPPPSSVYDVFKRLGPLQIASWADVNMLEALLWRYRNEAVARVKTAAEDEFVIRIIKSSPDTSGIISKYHDAYVKSQGLQWVKKDSELYIYSIGIDKIDDGGMIKYDPTNGLYSRGDMISRIEKQ